MFTTLGEIQYSRTDKSPEETRMTRVVRAGCREQERHTYPEYGDQVAPPYACVTGERQAVCAGREEGSCALLLEWAQLCSY